jgi:hypothetical protein
MTEWTEWRPFPDPTNGGYLIAPFGPGCYELRYTDGRLMKPGASRNVAARMSSLLPAPLGTGGRKNATLRETVGANLHRIEYRTIACATRTDAFKLEAEMIAATRYEFPD